MIREEYLGFIVDELPKDKPAYLLPMVVKKPAEHDDPLSLSIEPGKNLSFLLIKDDGRRIVHNEQIYKEEEYIEEVEKIFNLKIVVVKTRQAVRIKF